MRLDYVFYFEIMQRRTNRSAGNAQMRSIRRAGTIIAQRIRIRKSGAAVRMQLTAIGRLDALRQALLQTQVGWPSLTVGQAGARRRGEDSAINEARTRPGGRRWRKRAARKT